MVTILLAIHAVVQRAFAIDLPIIGPVLWELSRV